METENKRTGLAWMVFFASTVALILAIIFHFEYLTMILPFLCTSFVKAMDLI